MTAVVLGQASLLVLYILAFEPDLSYFLVFPLVWITVSAWVLLHARPDRATPRRHLLAVGVAVVYFLFLGYLGGMFSLQAGAPVAEGFSGLQIDASAPPGYAPAIFYAGSSITLAFVPYLVIGYLTLAYLVYLTILDTWTASASGLLGIFGCIGCSWPILASLVAGASGMSGAVATTVYENAYLLSTAAFLLAVGFLYYRPSVRATWARITDR